MPQTNTGKNLIFLADGTGNDSDIRVATNVYKLYQRLRSDVPGHTRMPPDEVQAHLATGQVGQVTQYDPGVGAKPTDIVGKATGRGISKNVKDGYEFLTRFYQPGDRIHLFGFSRGAYTVRSLAGLIGVCGVPARVQADGTDLLFREDARLAIVEEAWSIYRTQPGPEGRALRTAKGDAFIAGKGYPEHRERRARAPYLIGVWDTVRALGYPSPWGDIELPGAAHLFHDHDLSPWVRYAFHALAIDEARLQFYPTVWNEPTLAEQGDGLGKGQVFHQVWFPGVHSDIGGGYRETGLSDVTLRWMLERVREAEHPPEFYAMYAGNPTLGLGPDEGLPAHDSRDSLARRLLYPFRARNVVRGRQERGGRAIEPDAAQPVARLDSACLGRTQRLWRDKLFPSATVASHADMVRALSQSQQGLDPLPGPFSFVMGWPAPTPPSA